MKPEMVVRLHIPRSHKLVVYIWPDVETMRAKIKTLPGIDPEHADEAFGFFYGPRTKIRQSFPHNIVKRKVVGQIHLAQPHCGAGVFAHELQHFISWWVYLKDYKPFGRDWERVPYLVQRLTTKFWVAYYDHFGAPTCI